jgi:hypothetical protein
MELNDLLSKNGIDPARTLVLRHRPTELLLRRALPLLLAAERLDIFDAYQAYQNPAAERSFAAQVGGWLASFIAHGPARAVFVGLYKIEGAEPESSEQYWARPENHELVKFGLGSYSTAHSGPPSLRFDLSLTSFHEEWRGKLVIHWPPPERSWVRRAHKNQMRVLAIREESAFAAELPAWDDIDFTWAELQILPQRMRGALEQWRGIYLIWDQSDGKAYVGSAYGSANILGRWENYSATGHGGNKHLRGRDPNNFRFTVLERVSPDMPSDEVIRRESSWKRRLHSAAPHGLNDN